MYGACGFQDAANVEPEFSAQGVWHVLAPFFFPRRKLPHLCTCPAAMISPESSSPNLPLIETFHSTIA